MYYVLTILFFIILYLIFTKLLSSIVKGCLLSIGIVIFGIVIFVSLKSTKEKVILFNTFEVDNFQITRHYKLDQGINMEDSKR